MCVCVCACVCVCVCVCGEREREREGGRERERESLNRALLEAGACKKLDQKSNTQPASKARLARSLSLELSVGTCDVLFAFRT
jgi:hypothetical protein